MFYELKNEYLKNMENYDFKRNKFIAFVKLKIKLEKKYNEPLINERWISEAKLFNKLCDLFSEEKIERHGRPH